MLSPIRKSAAVGAVVLAMIGIGGAAASAAPVPTANVTAVSTATSHAMGTTRSTEAPQAAPERSANPLDSCTWNPANNANITAYVGAGWYPGVSYGPDCDPEGLTLVPGDPVTVHCGTQVGTAWYDYVTGLPPTPSFAGWVWDGNLDYPPAHLRC